VTTDRRASRDLIHRAHDREVLVSPPWRAEEGAYGSRTVTTDISTYYLDHPTAHWADLLLLTEACRQAALSVTHQFEGLPRDIAFFINSIEVEVSDVHALVDSGRELMITTLVEQLRLRGNGSPKRISYSQLGPIGAGGAAMRTTMTVQGVPKDLYRELRAYQRGGTAAPTTADLRDSVRRRDGLSAPATVGRTQTANVVLAELRVDGERSSATLAPDFSNASLFDHDYDHFPAMVLLEAGRQLALAGTPNPSRWIATGVHAEFLRFAELDRTTTFTAHRHGDRTEIVCAQHDVTVTRMSFDLEPIGVA
jgi:2-oxo-3-(phosphooxy)propyl 3-oxoalkanoate synthase